MSADCGGKRLPWLSSCTPLHVRRRLAVSRDRLTALYSPPGCVKGPSKGGARTAVARTSPPGAKRTAFTVLVWPTSVSRCFTPGAPSPPRTISHSCEAQWVSGRVGRACRCWRSVELGRLLGSGASNPATRLHFRVAATGSQMPCGGVEVQRVNCARVVVLCQAANKRSCVRRTARRPCKQAGGHHTPCRARTPAAP